MAAVLLCAASLGFLAGCVPVRVHEVKGPDGKTALALKCGDATACYEKAGELCPAGYDFVDRNNANVIVPVNGSVVGGTYTTLVVECKTPATTKN
jgi:hypothetical protein